MRAKFTLVSKEEATSHNTLSFRPVTGGSKENEQFFKYTPSGEIKIGTVNKAVFDSMQVGAEYYVDFTMVQH